jgi:hypothetical protein
MTNDIKIIKGNDLYFPQGNENGDYYEPLFIAKKDGAMAHGRTPEEAISNLIADQMDDLPDADLENEYDRVITSVEVK